MESILVTGATGFIGRHLLKKLSLRDYKVAGISRTGGITNNVVVDAVDCTDAEALNRYCEGKSFDGVIHLAASIPSSFWDNEAKQSIVQNVQMTMNILEVCKKLSISQLTYASSTSIYGFPGQLLVTEETLVHPNGFYPLGKFLGELLCHLYQNKYNLAIAILRISSPYGPEMNKETVVKKFIRQALLSKNITLYGSGTRSQDFTYIEDITQAITQAYEAKAIGIFNVSSGTSTSMEELARIVLKVLPKSKSEIVYTGIDDPQDNYRGLFSIEKAGTSFGYKPRFPIKEGIRKYTEAIEKELAL